MAFGSWTGTWSAFLSVWSIQYLQWFAVEILHSGWPYLHIPMYPTGHKVFTVVVLVALVTSCFAADLNYLYWRWSLLRLVWRQVLKAYFFLLHFTTKSVYRWTYFPALFFEGFYLQPVYLICNFLPCLCCLNSEFSEPRSKRSLILIILPNKCTKYKSSNSTLYTAFSCKYAHNCWN